MAYDVFRSDDFVARAVTGFDFNDLRGHVRFVFGYSNARTERGSGSTFSNRAASTRSMSSPGPTSGIRTMRSSKSAWPSRRSHKTTSGSTPMARAWAATRLSGSVSTWAHAPRSRCRLSFPSTRRSFPSSTAGSATPSALISSWSAREPRVSSRSPTFRYDPFDLDRRHVDLFREKTELVELAIPHGGHPVTGFMAEAGILGDFVLRIVNEQFDLSAFKSRVHTARKRSAQFWSVLSERARNPKVRTALAKRALSISPDDVVYQFKYARILAQYGNFEESEAIFNEAVRNHPTNPVLLYNLSEMHEWRGDFKEALSVMRRLVEAHPEAHIYDHRVAYLTNRFRVSTVMDSVGLIARRGFGRPIDALVRRLRGGVDAFIETPCAGAHPRRSAGGDARDDDAVPASLRPVVASPFRHPSQRAAGAYRHHARRRLARRVLAIAHVGVPDDVQFRRGGGQDPAPSLASRRIAGRKHSNGRCRAIGGDEQSRRRRHGDRHCRGIGRGR